MLATKLIRGLGLLLLECFLLVNSISMVTSFDSETLKSEKGIGFIHLNARNLVKLMKTESWLHHNVGEGFIQSDL